MLMKAARQHVDGRDGWLGKALVTQVWDLKLSAFETPIRLPLPPLQEVMSVTVGGEVMDAGGYVVAGANNVDKAEVSPATSWPSVTAAPEAVSIRFRAGYGDVGSDVPEPIRQAMLLLIGHWYEHREAVIVGTNAMLMPMAVNSLLAPYRTVPGLV
jgi:uncharacterized phiE125 gp8 family phage protein